MKIGSKNNNVTIVEMGNGTVGVTPMVGISNGVGILALDTIEQKKIGEPYGTTGKTKLCQKPIDVLFIVPKGKTESIDVMIESLKELKKIMLDKEAEGEDRALLKSIQQNKYTYETRKHRLDGLWEFMPEKYAHISWLKMCEADFEQMIEDGKKARREHFVAIHQNYADTKVLLRFLGWKEISNGVYETPFEKRFRKPSQMEFISSYDWLSLVVKALINLGYAIMIKDNYIEIGNSSYINKANHDQIRFLYEAVLDFVKTKKGRMDG